MSKDKGKTGWFRWLAHLVIVRPFVHVILGVNIYNRGRLPRVGPAIIVANHNNHIDTMILMSLFPLRKLPILRAAAAADYFLTSRLLAWISLEVFNIIPIKRIAWRRGDGDPLEPCSDALRRGEILILYPEGTRGDPERLSPLKTGIAHLAKAHPGVPVIPVFLRGLGKVLPKGAILPVPFICDACVGHALFWNESIPLFMASLKDQFIALETDLERSAFSERAHDRIESRRDGSGGWKAMYGSPGGGHSRQIAG